MPAPWETFIDNLIAQGKQLAKDELVALVSATKNDTNDFLRKQGEKLERYLNQLAKHEITKSQFEGYMRDLKKLAEMEALKDELAARASFQRLAEGIGRLVLEGLVKMV